MPSNDRSPDSPPANRIRLGRLGGKHVRLDPAFHAEPAVEKPGESDTKAPATPEGGWLMELLRRAIRSRTEDRRSSIRHDVLNREVWVGWWVRDEFEAVSGSLMNLSRGGAMIALPRRPPKKQPIWVYKEVDDALVCARGELVGLTPAPHGAFHARLRFAAPCPTIFCEAALCGRPAESKRRRTQIEPKAPPFGKRS